jgi:predicted  nucleic acid-binding Zn-ribbon protein
MTKEADLYRLQCLDSEGDAKQSRLAEIRAALGESQAVEQARQALETAQASVKKWSLRQRDLELELQGMLDKTARSEQRLYSGAVTNPKELTDLQAEIASLRRRRERMEDNLLEAMIEREEAETTHARAQQHVDDIQARWSLQQADLTAEQHALQERLAEIEQARAELLPKIEADDLATYQHLRRRKGGLAVTQVSGDACSACGMAISPNLEWQLRREGLGYCSNCERIIVRISR